MLHVLNGSGNFFLHFSSCTLITLLVQVNLIFLAVHLVRVSFSALMGASLCCLRSPCEPSNLVTTDSLGSVECEMDFTHSWNVELSGCDETYTLMNVWGIDSNTKGSRRRIHSCKQLTTIQEESPSIKGHEKTISTRTGSYGSLAALSASRCRTISSSDDDSFFPGDNFGSMKHYQRFVTKNYKLDLDMTKLNS